MAKKDKKILDRVKEFAGRPKVEILLDFVKSYLLIMLTHAVLSVIPLLFLDTLTSGYNGSIKAPRSAGEVTFYATYIILFVAAYYIAGRVAFGRMPYERKRIGCVIGRIVSSLLISVSGVLVLYCVLLNGNAAEAWMVLFCMPQLIFARAITEKTNEIFSTIAMFLPAVLIWIGFFANGFSFKKKKRSEKK